MMEEMMEGKIPIIPVMREMVAMVVVVAMGVMGVMGSHRLLIIQMGSHRLLSLGHPHQALAHPARQVTHRARLREATGVKATHQRRGLRAWSGPITCGARSDSLGSVQEERPRRNGKRHVRSVFPLMGRRAARGL